MPQILGPYLSILNTGANALGRFFTQKHVVLSLGLALGGRALFPPFAGPLSVGSSITYHLPIYEVSRQVQCELKEVVYKYPHLLDPKQTATASLKAQTDSGGSLTWVGIDFNAIGLSALSSLIVVQKNVSSLQADIKPKSTIVAQLDFTVPQTYQNQTIVTRVQNPDFPTKKFGVKASVIKGLKAVPESDCYGRLSSIFLRLYLKDWFDGFVRETQEGVESSSPACATKITLNTQFQIMFDVGAGFNPFTGSFVIVPVSGVNGAYNFAYTHSLQLTFPLAKAKDPYCIGLPPEQQPNRTIL